MLKKLNQISSIVMLLFVGASMLQSISPLVMSEMSTHHSGEKMSCSIDGNCAGSCSVDEKQACSCNHGTSNGDSTDAMLCGCDHHGDEPVGIHAPFQIKAPLVSAFDDITFSQTAILLSIKKQHLFTFTDDIFHPPRLRA